MLSNEISPRCYKIERVSFFCPPSRVPRDSFSAKSRSVTQRPEGPRCLWIPGRFICHRLFHPLPSFMGPQSFNGVDSLALPHPHCTITQLLLTSPPSFPVYCFAATLPPLLNFCFHFTSCWIWGRQRRRSYWFRQSLFHLSGTQGLIFSIFNCLLDR